MDIELKSLFARVKSALMRRGRSEHEANDLMQEAYLRMLRQNQHEQIREPEAYLMKTALNLSIDVHRARLSRGEEVMIDEEMIIDASPGVEDVLLSRERLDRLSQCLSRMNERTRTIFLAHRVEGLTYQEIGRIHGLSISGVEGHVSRASLLVAGWMKGWYP